MHYIGTQLSTKDHRDLRIKAAKAGKSISSYLRDLVLAALASKATPQAPHHEK